VQRLEQISEWNHNYLVSRLAACGNHIVAGDQISSVSLLSVDGGGTIKTVAKNHGPLWPIAVDMFDQRSIVGANVSTVENTMTD
jgi:DNA damage-binding protein 1